jgi:hypothetical protein
MTTAVPDAVLAGAPLRAASIERLACLVRHWAWAEEAKLRFDRELAEGWDYDEDLAADRPFGSFYHWCALLSGLAEAALEHQLLSSSQLLGVREDLEASLSDLQACRDLLVAIPSSMENHPLVIDLLRDEARLERLRRLHIAFGDALRRERVARDVESLGA